MHRWSRARSLPCFILSGPLTPIRPTHSQVQTFLNTLVTETSIAELHLQVSPIFDCGCLHRLPRSA